MKSKNPLVFSNEDGVIFTSNSLREMERGGGRLYANTSAFHTRWKSVKNGSPYRNHRRSKMNKRAIHVSTTPKRAMNPEPCGRGYLTGGNQLSLEQLQHCMNNNNNNDRPSWTNNGVLYGVDSSLIQRYGNNSKIDGEYNTVESALNKAHFFWIKNSESGVGAVRQKSHGEKRPVSFIFLRDNTCATVLDLNSSLDFVNWSVLLEICCAYEV